MASGAVRAATLELRLSIRVSNRSQSEGQIEVFADDSFLPYGEVPTGQRWVFVLSRVVRIFTHTRSDTPPPHLDLVSRNLRQSECRILA